MLFRASRTTHSLLTGTSKLWKCGAASCSGEYRAISSVIVSAISVGQSCLLWLSLLGRLLAIDAFSRRPARDAHRLIFHAGGAVGIAVHQRVGQELLIVACRIVGPLVRSPRFSAMQRALHHRLGDVEHKTKLKSRLKLSIEGATVIVELEVAITLLQIAQFVGSRQE